ncbi:MAG: hypothetical protein WCS52_05740 [bacterium]
MTLNQLICSAASVYPESFVFEYWSMTESEPQENRMGGDTLAQFIAQEIHDTYDVNASDTEQIASAVKAMQTAADDLQRVADALAGLTRKKTA